MPRNPAGAIREISHSQSFAKGFFPPLRLLLRVEAFPLWCSSTIGQQALHRQGPLGFRPALLHIPDGHRFHGAWAKMFHAGANELNPAKYFKRPGMENPQIALEIVIFNQPSTVKIEKHPENGNF